MLMAKSVYLIRCSLSPIVCYLLPFLFPALRKRKSLEAQFPFKKEYKNLDVFFEISSEGELAQILPLLELYLSKGDKVGLIFCSPSVVDLCCRLKNKHQNLVLICLPLISFNGFGQNTSRWFQNKTFFLCRYDFFPELIILGQRQEDFILLSGSLKNWNTKGILQKAYLKECYRSFSKIIAANSQEEESIKTTLNLEAVKWADFRILEIKARLERKEQKFSEGPLVKLLVENIRSVQDKIIYGSFWAEEGHLVSDKVGLTVIVPHLVTVEYQNKVQAIMQERTNNVFVLNESTSEEELQSFFDTECDNKVIVFALKGYLCELYTLFDFAYIGGGVTKSIHSVLEPYLAGCLVTCGPKVFKSSEFDFIKATEPSKIKIVNHVEEINDLRVNPEFAPKALLEYPDIHSIYNWINND